MVNFIQENWQIVVGFFGSVFAYFGGRKLKKAEEGIQLIDKPLEPSYFNIEEPNITVVIENYLKVN